LDDCETALDLDSRSQTGLAKCILQQLQEFKSKCLDELGDLKASVKKLEEKLESWA
jgi:hypothetical protein